MLINRQSAANQGEKKMYSLEQFEKKTNEITTDRIKILSFSGVKKPVVFQCLKCGKIQEVKRGEVLLRKGKSYQCSYCHYTKEKITEENGHKFENFCQKQGFEVLEKGQKQEKWKIRCKKCGTTFEVVPRDFMRHGHCRNCNPKGGNPIPLEIFKQRLQENRGDEYQMVDESQYRDSHYPILFRHSCGFIWKAKPTRILTTNSCPKCCRKISKGEKRIIQLLESNNVNYVWQKAEKINNSTLYFDFFIPEKNIYIEFQGAQHYEIVEYWGGEEGLKKRQKNDAAKREWCDKNNYTLITISFRDYDRLEEILKVQRLF